VGPVAVSVATEVSQRSEKYAIDRRAILVLACGHGSADIAQGAVPALLPFLHHDYGYSYAALAALVLAMTITSSLIQPIFGYLADRRSLPWLLPAGVLVAGIGIALSGLSHSYPLTFAAIAVSGLGVGAYHPEGARYANYVCAGPRRATGMSFYSVGGNVGFALGPILVTPLVLAFGMNGTAWLAVLYAVMLTVVLLNLAYVVSFRPVRGQGPSAATRAARPDRWGPFSLVSGVASFRSAVYFGLQSFLAVYLIHRFHVSESVGNAALTVMLVMGAIGTLVGGRLGDRIGLKPVLLICIPVIAPLIALLLVGGLGVDFVLVALIGFFTVGTFSTTVVLGQHFLPNQIGVASGITMGAAIGVGGVCATLLGLLADATSLSTVMAVIVLLPLPGLVCALLVPKS
jgi:FSR family fosmidomycin resistance protein-like MFS transporter